MRQLVLIFLLSAPVLTKAQQVEVIEFSLLERIINSESGNVTVINFWATWCGPCIKEIPHFEELGEAHSTKVDVVLVSLDFVEKLDQVKAFVNKKGLKSRVLLLDDIDYNSWIDKVDERWSGAIPATLILLPDGDRIFIGEEVSRERLFNSVTPYLNP